MLVPEVRRLVDWKAGFASISIVSALPLLAILPLLLQLFPFGYSDRFKRLDPGTAFLVWVWLGGFSFSFAVAILQHNVIGGAYSYAEFCLPAVFGLWLATSDLGGTKTYDRFASFLLWFASAAAIYGVVQFLILPPWDQAWMKAANIIAIGIPEPFMFRPFSTLNSPGFFADVLVIAILMNLPRLRRTNVVALVQIALLTGVLVLTMVRSDWLGGAVGALVFVLLSPNRLRNFAALGVLGLICAALVSNASLLLGNADAGNSIATRIDTFENLGADASYQDRQKYFGTLLTDAFEQPLGQGLGVVGTAAKLGDAGETVDFDNGYVARFTEMGYFGVVCYLATVFGALGIAVRAWRKLRGPAFVGARSRTTAIIAVQAALLTLDISGDHHNALPGLFFWLAVALLPALATAAPEPLVQPKRRPA